MQKFKRFQKVREVESSNYDRLDNNVIHVKMKREAETLK